MRIASVMFFVLALAACSTVPYVPPTRQSPSERHVVDASYQIGVPVSATVGDAMLRVKDYYTGSLGVTGYILDTPLTYHFHPFGPTRFFPAGTPFGWLGTITVDGRTLRLITPQDGDARMYPLLVDADGIFSGLAMGAGGVSAPFHPGHGRLIELSPVMPRFHVVHDSHAVTDRPYHNYELIYGGTDGRSIHLLYREFTRDDLARPAFTQNLTYPQHAPLIRFRALAIKVLSADASQIRFVVEADGRDASHDAQ